MNLDTDGVLPAKLTHENEGPIASTPVFTFMVKQPPLKRSFNTLAFLCAPK